MSAGGADWIERLAATAVSVRDAALAAAWADLADRLTRTVSSAQGADGERMLAEMRQRAGELAAQREAHDARHAAARHQGRVAYERAARGQRSQMAAARLGLSPDSRPFADRLFGL